MEYEESKRAITIEGRKYEKRDLNKKIKEFSQNQTEKNPLVLKKGAGKYIFKNLHKY